MWPLGRADLQWRLEQNLHRRVHLRLAERKPVGRRDWTPDQGLRATGFGRGFCTRLESQNKDLIPPEMQTARKRRMRAPRRGGGRAHGEMRVVTFEIGAGASLLACSDTRSATQLSPHTQSSAGGNVPACPNLHARL
jgi:hypothetical protein